MTENDKIVERELLLALQQGSRQAFEQIYHMYALRLTAKLIQLVKSEEIAQDLSYGANNIPAKFVIDKNVNMQFKSAGFRNDADLMTEIEAMITTLEK